MAPGIRNHGQEFPTPKTCVPLPRDRRTSQAVVDTRISGMEADTRGSREGVDTRTFEAEAGRPIPVSAADSRRPEVEE